jgi:hypothetical protein
VLFLSYADEDGEAASQVAASLERQGEQVYQWRLGTEGQRPSIERIEELIGRARAFAVLLSPEYLSSALCRWERDLAWCRERSLQMARRPASFFYVLRLREIAGPSNGFPGRPDWLDLTDLGVADNTLREMLAKVREGERREGTNTGAASSGIPIPLFRNRVDEINVVLRALTNVGGEHFWLVIAPPQLGKTWLLDRLGAELALGQTLPWEVRLVDLRNQHAEVRADPVALLRIFFGEDVPDALGLDAFRQIARQIIASRRPHVCLLDDAELLDEETALALRSSFAQIYEQVRLARSPNIRLALVLAGRRDDAWRSVVPSPRISMLSLTEFKVDVVERALQDLANQMDRNVDQTEIKSIAELALGLSEGLPALLTQCFAWISSEEWLGWDRLGSQQLFMEFAEPYIRDILLSHGSLFPLSEGQYEPQGRGQPGDPRLALVHCFRVLAPYRLFTQSHVRHHWASDPDLERSVNDLAWSMEDLWRAISGTALLSRPLNEPWQQILGAIRRLLFRYYYATSDEQEAAHREARRFVETWAERQQGKEQVIGLVECLWHEAAGLRLGGSSGLAAALSDSARTLSHALRESSAYTVAELRDYAAHRMAADEELMKAIGNDGLFHGLITIVLKPDRT